MPNTSKRIAFELSQTNIKILFPLLRQQMQR